jgi:hypothetical protein
MVVQTLTKKPTLRRINRKSVSPGLSVGPVKCLLLVLLPGIMALSACGGGTSNSTPLPPPTLSGNWQFTMGEQLSPDQSKPSFTGGLQGGFLLQTNGAITGQAVYSIMTEPPSGSGGNPTECNSGIDQITGTITGQTVSLSAGSTGAQMFTLTGTLSLDASTMAGSYTSTDGAGCGIVAAQNWSAVLVPPITGPVQGTFQSSGGAAGLNEQDFLVTGALNQAANTGASSAAVTGNLSFLSTITDLSDYPCFSVASVTGQISGNSVFLQLIGTDGSNIGQIGQNGPLVGPGPQVVTLESTSNGYVLQSSGETGYAVYAAACGGGDLANPADQGNICLAVNGTTGCSQPITLTPSALNFPAQAIDSPATFQTITMTNSYGSMLGGLTVTLTNTGQANFTETDTCGAGGVSSLGQPFVLSSKQACVITVAFSPLQVPPPEDCAGVVPPAPCLAATLIVTSPNNDAIFTLPITGQVSSSAAAVGEFDFGTERLLEASVPQAPRFTKQKGDLARSIANSSARTLQDEEHHAENN